MDLYNSTWKRLFSMLGAASPSVCFFPKGYAGFSRLGLPQDSKMPASVCPAARLEVREEALEVTHVKKHQSNEQSRNRLVDFPYLSEKVWLSDIF